MSGCSMGFFVILVFVMMCSLLPILNAYILSFISFVTTIIKT